jgi:hypothetical protein
MQTAPSVANATKREISALALFSTILSFVVLVLACIEFADNPRMSNEPRSILRGIAAVDVGFVGMLFLSGLGYVAFQMRWIGILHAFFMTGVGLFCIKDGAAILFGNGISVGHGSDANPAAGILYIVAIGGAALGIFCLCFALLLWNKTLRSPQNNSEPSAQRPSY